MRLSKSSVRTVIPVSEERPQNLDDLAGTSWHGSGDDQSFNFGYQCALIDVRELLTRILQDLAEKHHRGTQQAAVQQEADIEDGKIQGLIELYAELFDVDWMTAEEIVHPDAELGDNDLYREVSRRSDTGE